MRRFTLADGQKFGTRRRFNDGCNFGGGDVGNGGGIVFLYFMTPTFAALIHGRSMRKR